MTQDPDALRADIENQRSELGDTVGALTHRADIPSRAREQGAHLRDQARHSAENASATARQEPAKAGAVVAGAVLTAGAVLATVAKVRKAAKARSGRSRAGISGSR